MAMQPVYLVSVKNLGKFLEALRHAQAPEKLSLHFIEDLGFTSTNDRLFIPLLKAMRFVDEAGKPTARYHSFLDDTQWKQVLAAGIKDAYSDLFRVNRNAQSLSRDQLSGKIKSLSEGKMSPAVLSNTTKTFVELAKLADFATAAQEERSAQPQTDDRAAGAAEETSAGEKDPSAETNSVPRNHADSGPTFVYRIEIVLPAVRDQAIYDAIFRSARQHLVK